MEQVVFCNICDKAEYLSGSRYHRANCRYINAGYDCYCLEDENVFCTCKAPFVSSEPYPGAWRDAELQAYNYGLDDY